MIKESSNLKRHVKIFAPPASSCESAAVQQTNGDSQAAWFTQQSHIQMRKERERGVFISTGGKRQ